MSAFKQWVSQAAQIWNGSSPPNLAVPTGDRERRLSLMNRSLGGGLSRYSARIPITTLVSAARTDAANYLVVLVVNQICGLPLTPAFSIVVFRSGDDAKALALSAVLKSCVTVTSFALSRD